MSAQENAAKEPLWKSRPELFDGYDGTERDGERQQQFSDYCAEMLKSAPNYIKQAVADGKEKSA